VRITSGPASKVGEFAHVEVMAAGAYDLEARAIE
jgi:hypothetical protein